MGTISAMRFVGVCAASAGLMACSGAQWTRANVAARYRAAPALTVTVKASSERADLKEAVEELTTTLRDELHERGIKARFASADASPGARLSVRDWDPGSRALRYLVGFGSGEGSMTVVVEVTGADGSPALEGEVRGYVRGGFFGGSSMDAPREAGKAIAEAIATGEPE